MKLRVDFWDVGQGDASVVTLPDGRLIVIDVGPADSPLQHWLAKPDKKIYAIVLTHHHEDHVGALIPIMERCRGRIEHIFFSQSSHGNDPFERKILSAILRGWKRGDYTGHLLQVSAPAVQKIFGKRYNDDLSVYCCYPDPMSFVQNQVRKNPEPNKVSAIICLDINSETEIIWPGDAPMQTVAKICSGKQPTVLVGPHHGGPETRGMKTYLPAFGEVDPDCVFVSVGTDNAYQHPLKHDFVLPHVNRGRHLCCSQLKHCDRRRVERQQPVMNHHLAMGLTPPTSKGAVTCRGPMQLTWNSNLGGWNWDQWHAIHRNRIEGLNHPWCLR